MPQYPPFRVIPRSEWKAQPPRSSMAQQAPPREAFLHYSDTDDAGRIDTQAEAVAAVRGIQSFHMGERGWSDVAYHFLVVQPQHGSGGWVFAGRATRFVPAAQQGHNTGTLAVCVIAGPLDTIQRRTVFLIEEVIRRVPSVRVLGGHRDVTPTDCPGRELYGQIPRIARATGVSVFK